MIAILWVLAAFFGTWGGIFLWTAAAVSREDDMAAIVCGLVAAMFLFFAGTCVIEIFAPSVFP